jgi:hypothetical protein
VPSAAQVLAELARRGRRAGFSAERLCFEQQLAVRRSPAKRKVLRCSRRAGKTVYEAIDLLEDVFLPPFAWQYYVTISLKNAKRLIWPDLKRLNEEHGLGGIPNETEGYMRFPNVQDCPIIFLGGVKDKQEIEKLRGAGAKKFVVDEAQSIPDSIFAPLLKDVIRPRLMDYNGSLLVSGTPGPAPVGYFHSIDEGRLAGAWERFHWTWRENPWITAKSGRTVEDIEAEILQEHAWSRETPSFLREYCGLWVKDLDALVFHYTPERNHYDSLPGGKWTYIFGVDLGFDDADAIAVLGWSDASPDVYLIEEHVERKAGITELGNKVSELCRKYNPLRVWVDPGGLGKKITEELRRRWGIGCEAAEKTRKAEHIELLNDGLRTGRFRAKALSQFAEDAMLVQWDQDAKVRGVLREADGYHSDITDAVLYAYRACHAYHYQAPAPKLDEDQRMSEHHRRLAEQVDGERRLPWWQRDARRSGFR